MSDDEKEDLLNELYEKLDKLKGKTGARETKLRIELRSQIKDVEHVMTHEDWERFMSERSEINTRKCTY